MQKRFVELVAFELHLKSWEENVHVKMGKAGCVRDVQEEASTLLARQAIGQS